MNEIDLGFFKQFEILTLATIASLVTFKMLSNIYDDVYVPIIHSCVPNSHCGQTIYIGNVPIKYGIVLREILKWLIMIIIIAFIYKILKYVMRDSL